MNVKSIVSAYCPLFLRPAFDRIVNSPIGLRLARGVFWSLAGAVISRGLMLVASILVARMLGKTGYGELGMIQSTVGMFGVFAGFGMGLTATKHVAEFRHSDPIRAGRIMALSGLIAMLTGGLLALGLLIFAPWLAEHAINAPHLSSVLRIGAIILFVSVINGAQTGALSGFEAFRTIAQVNLYVGLISFPMLVGGVWFGGLTGAVWALAINLCFNWLLNHIALRKEARRYCVPFTFNDCSREMPILWKFSLPIVISGSMSAPVLWLCRSLLANQPNGYAELGIIAVAESWRFIPLFVCSMIAQVNLPVMAQLYSERKIQSFKKVLMTQFYLTGIIVVGSALLVVVASRLIIASYGPEFEKAAPVLIIIILSTIPMQLTTVVGTFNRCIDNIWWNVFFNYLWAALLLLATIVWVKNGALGLAGAILFSYSIQFVAAIIYLAWVMRTSPKLAVGISSKNNC